MAVRRPPFAIVTGIACGVVYGLSVRLTTARVLDVDVFPIVSVAFLVVMPAVIGYVTVRPLPSPRWYTRLFLPWLSCLLMVTIAAAIGWEGLICIAMALPIMLVAASVGGLLAAIGRKRRAVTAMMLALPFAVGPFEGRVPAAPTTRTVATSIRIAADPATVWANVVRVPEIKREEFRPRFIHRIGFPMPLAAEPTGTGVGSIRRATFDGGVLFTETVNAWRPERELTFAIRANTEEIPATTLDEHVTIGGPYFDVLEGSYGIETLPEGGIVLHLTSRYRLSTRVNVYAGAWTDFVMRSIQESILEVVRSRAESGFVPSSR